jgi:ElaB/YqjD/DUF883 family membrane-anchored ribosome-binding protein
VAESQQSNGTINQETNMSEDTTANQEARNKFESGKAHAVHAAEDLKAAAEAKAQELRHVAESKANEFRSRAELAYDEYRSRARTLREDGEAYIRENPLRAVVTALGVGFVLGLIFRR